MKGILAARVGRGKLYYLLDAKNENEDGVLVMPNEKPKIVPFWHTCLTSPSLKKLLTSDFHKWMWEKPEKRLQQLWFANFVAKTTPIEKRLLRSVPVNSDIMKAEQKIKSLDERADEFRNLAISQNVHQIKKKALG
jgi:hypothetical protein